MIYAWNSKEKQIVWVHGMPIQCGKPGGSFKFPYKLFMLRVSENQWIQSEWKKTNFRRAVMVWWSWNRKRSTHKEFQWYRPKKHEKHLWGEKPMAKIKISFMRDLQKWSGKLIYFDGGCKRRRREEKTPGMNPSWGTWTGRKEREWRDW